MADDIMAGHLPSDNQNDSGVILRFLEIARVLVRFDHVA
jgi:hypothetical protein